MILNDDFLELYTLMCRTISKPIRLKLLHLIQESGKANVSDLQKQLNVSMSNLSNHLADLYRSGILGREKQGNYVFYYLTDPGLLKGIDDMQQIIKGIVSKRDHIPSDQD